MPDTTTAATLTRDVRFTAFTLFSSAPTSAPSLSVVNDFNMSNRPADWSSSGSSSGAFGRWNGRSATPEVSTPCSLTSPMAVLSMNMRNDAGRNGD
jgi:hypothetical protein